GPEKPTHSPSPNLSLTRATKALVASSSRGPSHSISTSAPRPAASIMTPMMLLAFTRRSLRLMKISQGKLLASLVSLAEARACRPSLLEMVTLVLIMGCGTSPGRRPVGRDLHHPRGGAIQGARDELLQRLGRIVEGAPEHGHIDPGDDFDMHAIGQAMHGVAGGGPKHVGQHQNLAAHVARLSLGQ